VGKIVHSERSQRGRAIACGLALITLTACAPSFVKPTENRGTVFPYAAFGTFLIKDSKGNHRGMWEVRAWNGEYYRITIYSSVGTLLGCTVVEEDHHNPCRKGMKDLGDTRAWNNLPRELFFNLPSLLSGEFSEGSNDNGIFTIKIKEKEVMHVEMLQYEDEPFPHPMFIKVKIVRGSCASCTLAIRIQVEEISKASQ
jgi:hypothetical protein